MQVLLQTLVLQIVDTINGVDVTLGTYNYTYVMVTVTGDTVEVDRIVTVIGADNTAQPSFFQVATIEIEACDTYVDPVSTYDNLAPFDFIKRNCGCLSCEYSSTWFLYGIIHCSRCSRKYRNATRTVVVVDNTLQLLPFQEMLQRITT